MFLDKAYLIIILKEFIFSEFFLLMIYLLLFYVRIIWIDIFFFGGKKIMICGYYRKFRKEENKNYLLFYFFEIFIINVI